LAPYIYLILSGLIFGLIILLIAVIWSPGASETSFSPSPPKTSPYPFPPQSRNPNPIGRLSDFSDYGRGSRAYFLGEYDSAIRYFTAALDSHRPVGQVYNRRALAYDAKEEYEKALQDYEQALLAYERDRSFDSGPAMVHNNRACTYIALGEYGKAMTDLSRAIELEPTLGKAYYNRGLVEFGLIDYTAAIEDLSDALLYPASDSSPLLSQALASEAGGAVKEMLETNELERRLLETGVDRPSVLYQRARVYQAQGQVDSALADLDRAIEILSARQAQITSFPWPTGFAPIVETPPAEVEENRPQDPRVDLPSVYYLRASVYTAKGEYDQAEADFYKALELGFDPDAGP
jgi:tetratricopeptide (TPR) repeat protein